MDDLISRQEAIYAVNTALFPKINTAKDAEKALRSLPSAQPEIIRCKDCVYAADDDYQHCTYVTWWNGKDDFCSKGKRRTDE